MSDESIIIPIVVEPGKGLQGLSSFVNDANKRLSLIKGFKDGKLDIKVTVSTGNAPQQFTLLGKKAQEATDKIKKMGDQGSNTLMNIGRIAQDAPFGFMGIVNNINPLLESFQRLQVTTGSTKGALGALASQLTGPAGLGLAVSVVSSLLVVFGDKLLGSSKKADEAKERMTALGKEYADNVVKLTAVVGVIANVNTKYEDKQKALKYLHQEYKTYLDDIGVEKVTLTNLMGVYDQIIDKMLKQAVTKGLMEQISKDVEEASKKIIKIQLDHAHAVEESEKRTRINSTKKANMLETQMKMAQAYKGQARDGIIAQQAINTETAKTKYELDDVDIRTKKIKDTLMAQVKAAMGLTKNFEDLNLQLNKDKKPKKEKDETNEIISKAKEVAAYLKEHTRFKVWYEFDPRDSKAEALKKAQQFLNDVAKGNLSMDLKIVGLDKSIDEEAAKFKEKFAKIMAESDAYNANPKLPKGYSSQITDLLNKAKEDSEKLKKELNAVADVLTNTLAPAFTSMFDAIVSGKNPVQSMFAAIKQSIVQLISQIITAIVRAVILKALTTAISGGALGGAGGALSKVLGLGVKGLAAGGLAYGPTLALVGEGRGTNRNNPEVVAPLDQLKNFFGGMMRSYATNVSATGSGMGTAGASYNMPSSVRLFAAGKDLVGALNLEQQRQWRNG